MSLILLKKIINTFLAWFLTIVYITSEFNLVKKIINTFLAWFSAIVYVTSEFNFVKK